MKPNFSQVMVAFDDKTVQLELADTYERRGYGLMHRDQLCAECGMVFVYHRDQVVTFWMKDTAIPLDIAFVSSEGVVLSIHSLEPNDLNDVTSVMPVRYAIEMNQGWFERHKITVGSRFSMLTSDSPVQRSARNRDQ